jgi:hypothetical protein
MRSEEQTELAHEAATVVAGAPAVDLTPIAA